METKITNVESTTIDETRRLSIIECNEIAIALLKEFKTLSVIKTQKYGELVKVYGQSNTKSIIASAKELRKTEIQHEYESALCVLSYDNVLEREFKALAKDSSYKSLCARVESSFDSVESFVRMYYTYVSSDGVLLTTKDFVNTGLNTIFTAYVEKPLTNGTTALNVLLVCLRRFKNHVSKYSTMYTYKFESNVRTLGAYKSIYNVNGEIADKVVKGKEITGEQFDSLSNVALSSLLELSAVNVEMKKQK